MGEECNGGTCPICATLFLERSPELRLLRQYVVDTGGHMCPIGYTDGARAALAPQDVNPFRGPGPWVARLGEHGINAKGPEFAEMDGYEQAVDHQPPPTIRREHLGKRMAQVFTLCRDCETAPSEVRGGRSTPGLEKKPTGDVLRLDITKRRNQIFQREVSKNVSDEYLRRGRVHD